MNASIGRPPTGISTLPGSRVEPARAWTTTRVLTGRRSRRRRIDSASRTDAAAVSPSTGGSASPATKARNRAACRA